MISLFETCGVNSITFTSGRKDEEDCGYFSGTL